MERDTKRLGLISVGLGIAIVTLLPAHAGFGEGIRTGMLPSPGPAFLGNLRVTDALDIVQNILLFLPFGYFAAASVPHAGDPDPARPGAGRKPARARILRACVYGVCLSLGVELLQLWIPGRYSSMLDVLLNGMGAFLGGVLALAWRPDEGRPTGAE